MADPMRIRATHSGDVTEVKVLMAHPMETGLRLDGEGKPIPAHYIKTVKILCNDREVYSADWGPAVSKNPFLAMRFKGGQKGDKITVSWTDSAGENRSDEGTVN